VLLGLAQVTYRELIECDALEEHIEYAQIPCGSTRGRRPDTESTILTLLPTPGKKRKVSASLRWIYKPTYRSK
jgi:hypothetical protein